MIIEQAAYRSGLSVHDLVHELRALLAVERDAIRLTCRYLADLADLVEARSCAALSVYRDVYHAAQSLLGIGVHSTRERVRVGRAVRELPRIEQALASGEVSYSRAREVTRVARPEDEGRWLELARTLPMRQLEQRVAGAGADPGNQHAPKTSEPAQPRWTSPASVQVTLQLPAEAWALLQRAMEGARHTSETPLSDAQAIAAVARDALVHQETSGADASGPRRTVVLYECHTCERVELDTGAGAVELEHAAAATLGCGAKVRDLRTDGRLIRRGGPLPKSVERAVRLRDRNGCRVPGCIRRRYVDVHHIEEQSRGGEHSRRNCVCLCTSHHTLLHEGRLRIEGDADGELVVHDERGERIASQGGRPSVVMRGAAAKLLGIMGQRGGWTVDSLVDASGLGISALIVALGELQLGGHVLGDDFGYRARPVGYAPPRVQEGLLG